MSLELEFDPGVGVGFGFEAGVDKLKLEFDFEFGSLLSMYELGAGFGFDGPFVGVDIGVVGFAVWTGVKVEWELGVRSKSGISISESS